MDLRHRDHGVNTEGTEEISLPEGFVYLMADSESYEATMAKIGTSQDPVKRLNQMKTANPRLMLLKYWFVDCPKLIEARIHRFYAAFNIGLEWFELPSYELYCLEGYHVTEINRWFGFYREEPPPPIKPFSKLNLERLSVISRMASDARRAIA